MKIKVFRRGLLFIVAFFLLMILFSTKTTEKDKAVMSDNDMVESIVVTTSAPMEEYTEEPAEVMVNGMQFQQCDEIVTVATDTVNVRSEPSTENSDTIVTMVSLGDQVHRVGISEEWSMIVLEGYIESLYLKSEYLS